MVVILRLVALISSVECVFCLIGREVWTAAFFFLLAVALAIVLSARTDS